MAGVRHAKSSSPGQDMHLVSEKTSGDGASPIRTAGYNFSKKGNEIAAHLPFKIARIDQHPASTCPIRIVVWFMRKGLRTTVPMVFDTFLSSTHGPIFITLLSKYERTLAGCYTY